jgi:DNA-binding Lrp family transcriptional regulator
MLSLLVIMARERLSRAWRPSRLERLFDRGIMERRTATVEPRFAEIPVERGVN